MVASPRAKGMAIAFLNKQEQNIEFAAKLRQHRPNDGKDSGIPGDAGELLGLADDLDAAMFTLKSFSRTEETVEVTT